ncbi:hypothetical protein [Massilia horti]|uniref:Uncharacterized protein n=1 Tax=Massilia horti TaxID=2562153 RepID=A0A4Y9T3P6_9BURK|nr:hypothetical protein [Massilia horti]TFW34405.1 hypothetical protein E4O92_04175 [Massilia horti]
MLPLLRKRYVVRLGAKSLNITLKNDRRLPARRTDSTINAASDDRSSLWNSALDSLDIFLSSLPRQRILVEVIISNEFVRYAVIPWNDELRDAAEIESFARIKLGTLFGEQVAGWDLVLDRQQFGENMVACAVDPEMLVRLRALCRSRRAKLHSIVPELMARFNQHRHAIRASTFLYACLSENRCHLAYRDICGWQSLRSVSLSARNAEDLTKIIDRELLIQGCDDASIYVDLAGYGTPLQGEFDRRIQVVSFHEGWHD